MMKVVPTVEGGLRIEVGTATDWLVLEQIAPDALKMEKESLIEDFLIAYQEALGEIGFTSRDIARMAAAALAV